MLFGACNNLVINRQVTSSLLNYTDVEAYYTQSNLQSRGKRNIIHKAICNLNSNSTQYSKQSALIIKYISTKAV